MRVGTLVVVCTVAACSVRTTSGAEEASSGEASSTSSTTTTDSGSTSSEPLDPEAQCLALDRDVCRTIAPGVFCDWVTVTPVAIEDGACVLGEPVGFCAARVGGTTDPGCGTGVGSCGGEPHVVDLDGRVGAFSQCGGSAPIAAEPCTVVDGEIVEPPECACICVPEQGSSSSTSGSGTSTGE